MHFGMLSKKMVNIASIDKRTSFNITEIFNGNELYGSRLVVLSPCLFNVFTSDLHTKFKKRVRTIQYADDIIIYTRRRSCSECLNDFTLVLKTLKIWLAEMEPTNVNGKICIDVFY